MLVGVRGAGALSTALIAGLCGSLAAGCASSPATVRRGATPVVQRSVAADIERGDRWLFCGGVEDLDKAGASYDRAIAGAPDRVPERVFARRAEVYLRVGELVAGLEFVEDVALKRFPDSVPIREQKVELLRGLGRRDGASRSRNKRASDDRASPDGERSRTDAAYHGVDVRAVARCREALGIRSHRAARDAAWLNLARRYLRVNDARRARQAALEFVRLHPDDVRGWQLVGDAYFAQGDNGRALDYYRRARARGETR